MTQLANKKGLLAYGCRSCYWLMAIVLLLLFSPQAAAEKNTRQQAVSFSGQRDLAHPINEYLVSEKLDGIRGVWTGSQLLTKQGNIIYAPAWFTALWPNIALDGELWIKRHAFEQTASCVLQQQTEHPCWRKVNFMLFDLPNSKQTFQQRYLALQQLVTTKTVTNLRVIPQQQVISLSALKAKLVDITEQGAEGLMLHYQGALYQSGRNNDLLKVKQHLDGEAIVLKHLPGKGKFNGKLGALLVKTLADNDLSADVVFKIGTGFPHQQRLSPPRIGDTVTFKYFGKTRYGTPRFASFMRVRYQRQ